MAFRRRYLLLPMLAVLAFLAFGAPALAQSPVPSAAPAASIAPVGSPAPTVAGTEAPCPNPTPGPTQSLAPGETARPTPHPNLCKASPSGGDPFSLIAWAFTPIFQAIFLTLCVFYNLGSGLGGIGLAIILTTLLVRGLLIPIYRSQITSQRRMQMLQPELQAISRKYKGDRNKISQEQMKLYQERGYNPASGCLPTLITMLLLFPMYQVFNQGLAAPNITDMLTVFGVQVVHVTCQPAAATGFAPCLNPTMHVPFIGDVNASQPEILFSIPFIALGKSFGFSLLAFISALLQLVQTRMMMPSSADPSSRAQQRTFMLLPLLSLVYGSFLPAGLFIYWITTTIFSIVQQYLVAGWGSFFPLFGWTPGFALEHTPRFPVSMPTPKASADGSAVGAAASPPRRSTTESAEGTVKPNKARARTSRRGRRR
jgi:YidC/Oxa1 family membrane protein insertase